LIRINAQTIPWPNMACARQWSLAMWWSFWPTTWFLLAPLMMLACMAGMFVVMRGMHGRGHPGPHANPVLPESTLPFEEYPAEIPHLNQKQKHSRDVAERLETERDKAEFDAFMAGLNTRTTSSPDAATNGGVHGR
jgi:hypothetical protein